MVIRLKFLIIVLALLVNNCTYEKINTPGQKVIFIQEINIEGDKKAAFLMKRNLLRASNIKSENKIIIDMVLDNRTSIKEKNMQNKVTKYEMNINAKVTIKEITRGIERTKEYAASKHYDVADRYSQTINNKKETSVSLVNYIGGLIVEDLKLSYR
tara:strand:- start:35 stop:502 length:468 start_codon:yes stop_codon:yes gene_type:complete